MSTFIDHDPNRLRELSAIAAGIEKTMQSAMTFARSCADAASDACHTIDSLPDPEHGNDRHAEHAALLVEARALFVHARTFRRQVATELGIVSENAMDAEQAATESREF